MIRSSFVVVIVLAASVFPWTSGPSTALEEAAPPGTDSPDSVVAPLSVPRVEIPALSCDSCLDLLDPNLHTGHRRPVTGRLSSVELAVFDQVMEQFMVDRDITTATLAVSRGGKLVLSHGYGWTDVARTTVTLPDTPMRVASVSKPITLAALAKLVDAGRLSYSDRVFCLGQTARCLLDVLPRAGASADPRLVDITVGHLVRHEGGWDRDRSGDPMFMAIQIATDLGIVSPPSPIDTVRWVMGRSLDFAPGTQNVYSNFGYLLLGLVIQRLTGEPYEVFVHRTVLDPAGAGDMWLGHSRPAERDPREPFYACPGTGPSVFDPGKFVCWADGGFYLEAMAAHGGWVASAPALVAFLDHHCIVDGAPAAGSCGSWVFFGSLDGTFAMVRQRPDGLNIATVFNQRWDPQHPQGYGDIMSLLDEVSDALASGPSGLPAPALLSPPEGSVFDHYPRTTTVTWGAVSGATWYEVEVDSAFGHQWSSSQRFDHVETTSVTFDFVGAQGGRWRVRAVDALGRPGAWSQYRSFAYKV